MNSIHTLFDILRVASAFPFIAGLCACAGSSGDGLEPAPTVFVDPWAPVVAQLEASAIDEMAVIVGTADGDVFAYEKGGFGVAEPHRIASASKWLTGATVLNLVQQGVMQLGDQPQDYLPYWTTSAADPRSRITLEQLLSFTAGFHVAPLNPICSGDESLDLQTCARQIYDEGIAAEPGTTYFYGPAHMQVAAAMAEVASGQAWREVVRLGVAEPLGLVATGFAGDNPRASGSAISSAQDYAAFMRAQLADTFLAGQLDTLAAPRLDGVEVVSQPVASELGGVDWNYGLGVWRECDDTVWSESCDAEGRISSAGAFGWYPWLNLSEGYYAVIAVEADLTVFTSPASESVELGRVLHPLIVDALAAP